jgi:hypothetical protein
MAHIDGYYRYLNGLGFDNQRKIAGFLEYDESRITQLKSLRTINLRLWQRLLSRVHEHGWRRGAAAANARVMDSLLELLGFDRDMELKGFLKVSSGAVSQWRNGYSLIPRRQLEHAVRGLEGVDIHPLLEMEPIWPAKPGGKWYLYDDRQKSKRKRALGWLAGKHGVYCYFDSTGTPSYVGKADRTPLDQEAEGRLGARCAGIRYGERLKRPTAGSELRQGDVACFLSAYEVKPRTAIPKVEALLIRCGANVLLNRRLENLKRH